VGLAEEEVGDLEAAFIGEDVGEVARMSVAYICMTESIASWISGRSSNRTGLA